MKLKSLLHPTPLSALRWSSMRILALIVLTAIAAMSWISSIPDESRAQSGTGQWQDPGAIPFDNDPSYAAKAVLLPDGKVLQIGTDPDAYPNVSVFDPSRSSGERWSDPQRSSSKGAVANAVLLEPRGDCLAGCVLVQLNLHTPAEGGQQGWALYSVTEGWSDNVSSDFILHRNFASSVTVLTGPTTECGLNCGKVLVAGGQRGSGGAGDIGFGPPENQATARSAELYDPEQNRWAPTGAPGAPRSSHAAVLLDGPECGLHCGQVLVVGGGGSTCPGGMAFCQQSPLTAEFYNPLSGEWTWAPPPNFRHDEKFSATTLPDGRIFVSDMARYGLIEQSESHSEFFDPAANGGAGDWVPVWRAEEPDDECVLCRRGHTATALPNGKVLVIGEMDVPNSDPNAVVTTATMWQLASAEAPGERWTDPAPAPIQTGNDTSYHSAILLQGKHSQCRRNCGKILVGPGASGVAGREPRQLSRLFAPAPELYSADPARVPVKGGTAVTVKGSGLASLTRASIEQGGSFPCGDGPGASCYPDPQDPDALLHLVTPARPQGTAKLTVDTEGGVSNPLDLEYLPTPEVSGILPACGPLNQGVPLKLKGADLNLARTVKVGAVDRPFTVNSSGTELDTSSPAQTTPGFADVNVASDVGGSSIRYVFPCPPVSLPADDLPDDPVTVPAGGAGNQGGVTSDSTFRPPVTGSGPGTGAGPGSGPATPPISGPGPQAMPPIPETALAANLEPQSLLGPGLVQGQTPLVQPHLAPGPSSAAALSPAAPSVEAAGQSHPNSPARRYAMSALSHEDGGLPIVLVFGLLMVAGCSAGLTCRVRTRAVVAAAAFNVAR